MELTNKDDPNFFSPPANLHEQDKSSDIEQQQPFGDRKCSNTLHQKSTCFVACEIKQQTFLTSPHLISCCMTKPKGSIIQGVIVPSSKQIWSSFVTHEDIILFAPGSIGGNIFFSIIVTKHLSYYRKIQLCIFFAGLFTAERSSSLYASFVNDQSSVVVNFSHFRLLLWSR